MTNWEQFRDRWSTPADPSRLQVGDEVTAVIAGEPHRFVMTDRQVADGEVKLTFAAVNPSVPLVP